MGMRLGSTRAWAVLVAIGLAVAGIVALTIGTPVSVPTTSPETASPGTALLPPGTSTSPLLPTSTPTPSLAPSASPAPNPTAPSVSTALPPCPRETDRFPAGYAAYHTYAELCRTLVAAAAAHPDIARLQSIGQSSQGRELFEMEISTHVSDGTHPPGVLFEGGTHGLEHLSVEMPLAIMGWLLDGYGTDPTITRLVQTRAIFLVFEVNPDGAAFDISGGRFHEWRKNRQPAPGGRIGTDLNRNYDDHWGCCGLVSAVPQSSYYRGSAPFSAPETTAMRDFVDSLVFEGRQEIRSAISFHTSGRLILWPYGYTRTAIPGDMTAPDHAILVALARHMASLDGYAAEQASSLYVDSGTARDWFYGKEGIFAFTVELGTGTYQRSPVIASETARNRAAVLYLIDMAGCPERATSAAAATCG